MQRELTVTSRLITRDPWRYSNAFCRPGLSRPDRNGNRRNHLMIEMLFNRHERGDAVDQDARRRYYLLNRKARLPLNQRTGLIREGTLEALMPDGHLVPEYGHVRKL